MSLDPSLPSVRPTPEVHPVARIEFRPTMPEIAPARPAVESAQAFMAPATPEMPRPAMIITERGYDNLGTMLHAMFAEEDALPPQWIDEESPREQQDAYVTDREVWHDFLGLVMQKMKESDTLKEIRLRCQTEPESISEADIPRIYAVYERSLRAALEIMKPDLNPPQRHGVEDVVRHLDWSYKDVIANHLMAMQSGAEEMTYDTTDFLLLLNPKARKIEYTTTEEARRLVSHFGSKLSKDTIVRDTGRAVPAHLANEFPN